MALLFDTRDVVPEARRDSLHDAYVRCRCTTAGTPDVPRGSPRDAHRRWVVRQHEAVLP